MRIISQTKRDYPYEHIVVSLEENRVVCRPINDLYGRDCTLGIYDSYERANEVFESINHFYKVTPSMGDVETLYLGNVFIMPEE